MNDDLYMVMDDTNNVSFDEIDMNLVSSTVLERVDAVLAGVENAKDEEAA